jgi:hypothetical protein
MANWYSSNYGSGANVTSYPDPFATVSSGVKHARLRHSICHALLTDGGIAESDKVVFSTLKSGDRLISIKLAADASFTIGQDMDLGLYKSGDRHDGAVLDADLFGGSLDLGAGFALTENILSGVLTDEDIGKTLWEMATIGAQSYTVDPVEDWDVVGTIDTVGAAAGGEILCLLTYVSGA